MNFTIEPAVFAIDVTEDIRVHECVIERGVEHRALVRCTAFDVDMRKTCVPRGDGAIAHRIERRAARRFRIEIRLRVGGADVRDTHPHVYRADALGEAHPRT